MLMPDEMMNGKALRVEEEEEEDGEEKKNIERKIVCKGKERRQTQNLTFFSFNENFQNFFVVTTTKITSTTDIFMNEFFYYKFFSHSWKQSLIRNEMRGGFCVEEVSMY